MLAVSSDCFFGSPFDLVADKVWRGAIVAGFCRFLSLPYGCLFWFGVQIVRKLNLKDQKRRKSRDKSQRIMMEPVKGSWFGNITENHV